ncbi:AAA family ATPase [Ulvibacterium sp.]|uniref:AAA family ATPase n=1 Tax=Ulvibacterium sp. TaxID=2665914 RepID=UPI003BAA36E7
MNPKKIVITGGPSTGKTSVIESLEKMGFTCLHEVIRSMTLAEKEQAGLESFAINPIVSVKDPIQFNTQLLQQRIAQYKSVKGTDQDFVFFDRGIPDVLAYMDCFGQKYDEKFTKACKTFRYDLVLLMPPWPEIHNVDNARFESYEESLRVHECLKNTYGHFGYDLQVVPKDPVEERKNHILNLLNPG